MQPVILNQVNPWIIEHVLGINLRTYRPFNLFTNTNTLDRLRIPPNDP